MKLKTTVAATILLMITSQALAGGTSHLETMQKVSGQYKVQHCDNATADLNKDLVLNFDQALNSRSAYEYSKEVNAIAKAKYLKDHNLSDTAVSDDLEEKLEGVSKYVERALEPSNAFVWAGADKTSKLEVILPTDLSARVGDGRSKIQVENDIVSYSFDVKYKYIDASNIKFSVKTNGDILQIKSNKGALETVCTYLKAD
jgi:hypothetical protein